MCLRTLQTYTHLTMATYENEGQKERERLQRARERGITFPWEKSIHGTDPRDNPYGGEAKHHGGA